MICPKCNAENAETNRFCLKCGTRFITDNSAIASEKESHPYRYAINVQKTRSPLLPYVIIAGILGLLGGGIIILGWLTPWFSLGGLLNTLLRFLSIPTGSGLFNFGAGWGSGLQLTLFWLFISFVSLTSSETVIFSLIGILGVVIMVTIPFSGFLMIKAGIKVFEINLSEKQEAAMQVLAVGEIIQTIRVKSARILVIMAILYVLVAIIPFGTAVLGGGFYLVLIGSACCYITTVIITNRLRSMKTEEVSAATI